MKKEIYLLLGTNLGDKSKNLEKATEEISKRVGDILKKSTVLETEAWGFESEDKFLNQALCVESYLGAFELLDELQLIEKEIGREKKNTAVYESRIIDIDILFYGNEIIKTERLVVPHPLMHRRFFALSPVSQIAPKWVHPELGKNMETLLVEIVSR